jgi:protein-disulfide isomerase
VERRHFNLVAVALLFVLGPVSLSVAPICLAQQSANRGASGQPGKSGSSQPDVSQPISKEQADAILQELHEIRQLLTQQVQLLGNPSSHAAPPPAKVQIGVMTDWHVMGLASAPVTIVEFTDLECPFCRRFHADAFPLIKKNYIDTGKVKFISLDMPMEFHRYALKAAEASRCSGEQGKFWEMRDAILDSAMAPTVELILDLARQFQLNLVTFRSCVDSNKYRADIQKDFEKATGLRISGTPSFVVAPTAKDVLSGVLMVGAQAFPDFQSRIEAILSVRLKD